MLQEEVVQRVRIERIKQSHDEEFWIHPLKMYLIGDMTRLSAEEVNTTAFIAPYCEVDEDGMLFFCSRSTPTDDRTGMMRLVIPELLQKDVLHHFHTGMEGGHQEIGRTYQRIRACSHWRRLYRSDNGT